MPPQSNRRIAITILIVAILLLFWGLSTQSSSLANVFTSPLRTPTPMNLAFTSPLQPPVLDVDLSLIGPRYPREVFEAPTPSPRALAPDTFRSPLADPTPTLEPRGYLPAVYRNYPLPLHYGPKGLAGVDSFGLFKEEDPEVYYYDSYYTWGVSPNRTDPRLARMVWCVSDYHLYDYDYGDRSGKNFRSLITRTAQADNGNVLGRVWLVLNEPDSPAGDDSDPNSWQCGRFPLTGDPYDPENAENEDIWVLNNAAETAARYSLVYDWIKEYDPSAKVYVGGLVQLYEPKYRNWWTTFVNTLDDNDELYKIEGVHIHGYPIWSTGWGCAEYHCTPELTQQLNTWYNGYHVGLELGDRPIWITEIGAGWTVNDWDLWDPDGWNAVLTGTMQPMSWWFTGDAQWPYSTIPTNPGYDSIHWYTTWWDDKENDYPWWGTYLVDGRKEITRTVLVLQRDFEGASPTTYRDKSIPRPRYRKLQPSSNYKKA